MSAKGWSKVDKAWNNLSRRERVLIVITASVLPLMLMFVMVLEPVLDRLQGVDGKIESLERSLASQERLLRILQDAEIPDPDVKANKKLQALELRFEALSSDVDRFAQNLVGPEQMLGLLHSVLGAEKGLKILSASSLPVEPLVLSAETVEADSRKSAKKKTVAREKALQDAVIYIHPFELRLEGSYTALYRYLKKMEQLHQGFFWDILEYQSGTYPNAQIRLRVHTLSTEGNWLGA